jgi:hypothetical protein
MEYIKNTLTIILLPAVALLVLIYSLLDYPLKLEGRVKYAK